MDAQPGLRLDKWLFHARLFKTRGLAAERIAGGGLRLNGQPCRKPGRAVHPGDMLTVSAHGRIRTLRIIALGQRRGPAPEAQALYDEQDDASFRGPGLASGPAGA